MNENPNHPDSNHSVEERRAKLRELCAHGNAFPNDFRRSHLAADLHRDYGTNSNEELEPRKVEVTVAGRMMLKRVMGKASFATIQDMSGRIQIYVTNDGTGEAVHAAFKHWDLGDIVGATGTLFKTKTGELTVKATACVCSPNACGPCRKSSTAWPTRKASTASAISI